MTIAGSTTGGTKKGEYYRSLEHFKDIYENQGLAFALWMLADSEYNNTDLKSLAELEYRKTKKGLK